MSSPTCFVLDRMTHRVVYKAESMAQAQGYIDRRRKPSIVALSASSHGVEFYYRLALVDTTSGQVVASGPIVELFDAAESLCNLRIVILPCLKSDAESEVSQ